MKSNVIRVVRIIARMNVGGPARHLISLSDAMRGEAETVIVTGLSGPGEVDMRDAAETQDIRTVVLRGLQRSLSLRDAVVVLQLVGLLRKLRPDVIETHTAKAGAVGRVAACIYRWMTPGALAGRPRPVAVVHVFHGHVFHGYFGPRVTAIFVTIERLLARITNAIIVLSSSQQREINETHRIGTRGQFHVVPLAVDFSGVPERENDIYGRRRVSIVGRLTKIKNHQLFLEAASELAGEPAVVFTIYGDGEERERLQLRARQLGIEDRVRFHGTRPVAEICRTTDIAVLTSDNEGTPLSLIEAMGASIPVVSTAVGGVCDLLGRVVDAGPDGRGYAVRERGITVKAGDGAGLAAAVRRLLSDPALGRDLAIAGREYARTTFEKDRIAADIIALYRNLLAAQYDRGAKVRE